MVCSIGLAKPHFAVAKKKTTNLSSILFFTSLRLASENFNDILENALYVNASQADANDSATVDDTSARSDLLHEPFVLTGNTHKQNILRNMPNSANNADNIQCGATNDPRPQAINKLRIQGPANASPSSIHSSESEPHSPHRKKHKKRVCVKCDVRFKHKSDWLQHLQEHIDQQFPKIVLEKLDTDDNQTLNHLCKNTAAESRISGEHESLKITLKLPRTDLNSSMAQRERYQSAEAVSRMETDNTAVTLASNSNSLTSDAGEASSASKQSHTTVQNTSDTNDGNRCRIRVLKVEEIKRSPQRPFSTTPDLQTLPMVSIPRNDDINAFECPTFDGFDSIDTGNDTAELLKHLLESTNAPFEPNVSDTTSNEFITIDELAVACQTCRAKFPDTKFLESHQKSTGHGLNNGASSMFGVQTPQIAHQPPQQPTQSHHTPQMTNHLQQILSQPMKPMQQMMPAYGPAPNGWFSCKQFYL